MISLEIPWNDVAARNPDKLEWFSQVLTYLPKQFDGWWIAGGAIRGLFIEEEFNDIDFFFRGEGRLKFFTNEMNLIAGSPVADNDFNTTWEFTAKINGLHTKLKVQAIKIFGGDLVNSLANFDYTICQFGYDGKNFQVTPAALLDAGARRLVVHKITFATASMRRMLKYGTKGYSVCQGCMATLLQAVADKPEVIRHDIKYVD